MLAGEAGSATRLLLLRVLRFFGERRLPARGGCLRPGEGLEQLVFFARSAFDAGAKHGAAAKIGAESSAEASSDSGAKRGAAAKRFARARCLRVGPGSRSARRPARALNFLE